MQLEPCPFCGGRPKTKSTFVRCTECGGQMCFGETEELDSVIAAWNRRATAAKDAEIEALRAEVERLEDESQSRLEACGDAVSKLCAAEARAERLEEALRLALKWAEVVPPGEPLRKESEADLSAARAALEQENDDA